jgi:PHP family Zn ribbon phosphoesterase
MKYAEYCINMEYKADLHIHSVLSPCADWEMSPKSIILECKKKHIDIISITDHNSFQNQRAISKLSKDESIFVIYGIEVQSIEEIHILCYFETILQIEKFGEYIQNKLPKIKNNPEYFGSQVMVDENDEVLGEYPWLLINSVKMSFQEIIKLVHSMGGLAVPAHVYANNFSIKSQFGIYENNNDFIACEVRNKNSSID